MNDKHKAILEGFLTQIDQAYVSMFDELAEYAIELGYNPVRNKTNDVTIDFRRGKIKKSIMKIEVNEQKHGGYDYRERNIPGLRLRFFAAKEYSDIFLYGIRRVIEEFGGKYTGCYGCGRCDGSEGYTFIYSDGKQIYRCGSELISIFDFTDTDIPEIKKMLKTQADYYVSKLGK
jgi:type II restriction/modification system DNA methylase subunit YeeA